MTKIGGFDDDQQYKNNPMNAYYTLRAKRRLMVVSSFHPHRGFSPGARLIARRKRLITVSAQPIAECHEKKRLGRAVDFIDGPPQAFLFINSLMFSGEPEPLLITLKKAVTIEGRL
jgi:hypothetical protein